MKKIIFTIIAVLVCCSLAYAQEGQTIYSRGKASLPAGFMSDAEFGLTVTVTWEDAGVSAGGTGRRIVEEAVFKGNKGDTEIEFIGVRIVPSSPTGEITVEVSCRIGNDKFSGSLKTDYKEAANGKLLNLKLKMENIK